MSEAKNSKKEKEIDYCTFFPEKWGQWYLGRFNIPMIRKVSIKNCCRIHDEQCSTKDFIKCLKEKNIVGRYAITAVAATACLIRYRKV